MAKKRTAPALKQREVDLKRARVEACAALVGDAATRELARALSKNGNVHDALCRALVSESEVWDASRDPLELELAQAESRGWETIVKERRNAARDLNVFGTPAACPTCGVVGLYVYEQQMRRADEPPTSIRRCPNGHFGVFRE